MNMEISNAAQELLRFLSVLRVDRRIAINRMGDFPRIFKVLRLSGHESRELAEEEFDATLRHYKYFNGWLKKNGFIDQDDKLVCKYL